MTYLGTLGKRCLKDLLGSTGISGSLPAKEFLIQELLVIAHRQEDSEAPVIFSSLFFFFLNQSIKLFIRINEINLRLIP